MAHLLRKYVIAPTGVQENSFVCANPKDRANNVTAGCKHTPLRSVASLLRKHCPRPTNVIYMQCISVAVCFPVSRYPQKYQKPSKESAPPTVFLFFKIDPEGSITGPVL